MLDSFEVFTTSGVSLWSRNYAPVDPSIINSFITDLFIEEKVPTPGTKETLSASTNPAYRADQHTIKWTFVKELGLIFIVSSVPSADSGTSLVPNRFFTSVRLYIGRFYISRG